MSYGDGGLLCPVFFGLVRKPPRQVLWMCLWLVVCLYNIVLTQGAVPHVVAGGDKPYATCTCLPPLIRMPQTPLATQPGTTFITERRLLRVARGNYGNRVVKEHACMPGQRLAYDHLAIAPPPSPHYTKACVTAGKPTLCRPATCATLRRTNGLGTPI